MAAAEEGTGVKITKGRQTGLEIYNGHTRPLGAPQQTMSPTCHSGKTQAGRGRDKITELPRRCPDVCGPPKPLP